jgi:poly(A) polymerase
MAHIFIEPQIASFLTGLGGFLSQRGVECYLVGGYVRDGLMGRTSNDIDLAIGGEAVSLARKVADAFGGRFVLLDEINKVVRVVFPQKGWHLDFAALKGSIQQDLARRDFTIDAIAIDLEQIGSGWFQAQLIDPLNGLRDIEQGLITAVSENIFADDPLRLLRAVRLEAELGFTIEEATESLIKRYSHLITGVSGERIRDELCHILATQRAADSLRHLDKLGLLTEIIPELAQAKGVVQPKEHFWDVFEHSIETVAAVERLPSLLPPGLSEYFTQQIGEDRGVLLRLAALLHDVAKPMTKSIEENGKMRFLGHAQKGAQIAALIMGRLRFSSKEIRMVSKIIEYHLRPGQLANAEEPPTHRAIYRYFRDSGDVGIDTLFLSLADHLATRGPLIVLTEWHRHAQGVQYIISKWFEEQTIVRPPKLIDGHDLIDIFGLSPGPKIGQLLEAVREAQAAGEIRSRDEALTFVTHELKRESYIGEIP